MADTKAQKNGARYRNSQIGLIPPRLCYITALVNSFINRGLVVASISLVLQARMTDAVSLAGVTFGIATIAGVLLSSRWLSAFIISPLTGHLSDQWGRRPFLLAAFVLEILTLLSIAVTSSALLTAICAAILFVAGNTVETVARAAVADKSHQGSASVRMGIHATFDDTGSAAGPLIGYLLAGIIGFPFAYTISAVIVLGLFGVHIANYLTRMLARSFPMDSIT